MDKVAHAKLNNLRQSPRKVRLVADLIRGKNVSRALVDLEMLAKRASSPLKKLLNSAVANAKDLNFNAENLFIKKISVDEGQILYRRRYRARGRSAPVRKRTSHIDLVLAERKQVNSKKTD
jgi:large subunit ribosomal protein L22